MKKLTLAFAMTLSMLGGTLFSNFVHAGPRYGIQKTPEANSMPGNSLNDMFNHEEIQKTPQAEIMPSKGNSLKDIFITPEELCELKFEECTEEVEGNSFLELKCKEMRVTCHRKAVCSDEHIECLENADNGQDAKLCSYRYSVCLNNVY